MPLLPPVITATLSFNRIVFPHFVLNSPLQYNLDLFKITCTFPGCYGFIKGRLLGLIKMQIVFDYVIAEGFTGESTAFHQGNGIAQRMWNLGQVLRAINIAFKYLRWLDFVANTIQT